MLDYHLHLWPHGDRATPPTLDQIAAYVEAAAARGVSEIALTEHLFRFRQAADTLGGFWDEDSRDHALRAQMAAYWDAHTGADLEAYVECVLAARDAGLPVILGLEVDHYAGRMDRVAALLDGYPFDVLLGSVHWIDAWMFDVLGHPAVEHERRSRTVEALWRGYVEAMEELAASGVTDVLAHPDLAKVAGDRPDPGLLGEFEERIAEAAATSGMAAEVSSAGWRKPVGEQYPSAGLLDRFHRRGVPVTTASDAHRLGEVALRADDLRPVLAAAGYTELQAFRGRRGRAVPVTG